MTASALVWLVNNKMMRWSVRRACSSGVRGDSSSGTKLVIFGVGPLFCFRLCWILFFPNVPLLLVSAAPLKLSLLSPHLWTLMRPDYLVPTTPPHEVWESSFITVLSALQLLIAIV